MHLITQLFVSATVADAADADNAYASVVAIITDTAVFNRSSVQ